MQVVETKSEGLSRAYAMTLPASALAAKMNEKLEAAREEVQMKGFRKGKAPLPLLKKMFGKSLLGEIVQETVDGAIRDHFEQTGDRPALQPDVKVTNQDFDEGDDLHLELAYDKLPDIEEPDFSKIALEKPVAVVEDADVDEALAKLAEGAQTFEPREEGAALEEGDQLTFDFVGKVDGEPFEGGSAEDFQLVIGSGQFIPGFEPQLVGIKAGETKDVTVTFPEDYQAEHLAGKEAVFTCTAKTVAAPKTAEIDDELAKQFGSDDLAGLKEQVREQLANEYGVASRALVKRKLLDALDEAVSFDLPASLLDVEAQQIAHQLWHEEHPEVQGHNHDAIEPTEEHKKLAARRVRLGLLLAETGTKHEIQVSEQEIMQRIVRQAQQMNVPPQAFFEYVKQNEGAMQQIRAPLFEDKVVDYILELAQITEVSVSKDELQSRLEAMDAEDETAAA
ncbi:trigger factor [Albimonas sp. CAU 1670]|uniref:trigger factor n=1 Tax=Albimonas sp. CAU 1670 TaxID=3032599 RepID=UPI0023D9CA0A|nr:trigger factor [Albimonas sp. CAU 1670]MDF2234247.1 trigger factor [Albimonas sp. CAU 1670]